MQTDYWKFYASPLGKLYFVIGNAPHFIDSTRKKRTGYYTEQVQILLQTQQR